jgi:serine/threonine protein phosphatase 1
MSMSGRLLTYAIGDIHGCRDKLERLLYFCMRHRGDRPARFVFVGDYIDRGPDSRGVISSVLKLKHLRQTEVIWLRGNHEALLLNALPWGKDEGLLWVSQGGAKTLLSYGVNQPAEIPIDHLNWMQSLPLSFDDGMRLFVHAGVNPDLPLDGQREHDLLWIREPFLSHEGKFGRLIVHGHTPSDDGRPELRPNRVNIDTGAVFGHSLTCAVFSQDHREPISFITDDGPVSWRG